MKTEVVMKRELFGHEIGQQSKTEFFSATDLVKAGNAWRKENGLNSFNMSSYLESKGTKEFMNELELKYGDVIVKGRGRSSQTWVHPLLFIDMALAISPKLKIEVYQWLKDALLAYRNDSGESFKKMTGALFLNATNKDTFGNSIKQLSFHIRKVCGLEHSDWQHATEDQLALRDRIHENIYLLSTVLRDNGQAVNLGLKQALLDNKSVVKV